MNEVGELPFPRIYLSKCRNGIPLRSIFLGSAIATFIPLLLVIILRQVLASQNKLGVAEARELEVYRKMTRLIESKLIKDKILVLGHDIVERQV